MNSVSFKEQQLQKQFAVHADITDAEIIAVDRQAFARIKNTWCAS